MWNLKILLFEQSSIITIQLFFSYIFTNVF